MVRVVSYTQLFPEQILDHFEDITKLEASQESDLRSSWVNVERIHQHLGISLATDQFVRIIL